MGVRDSGGWWNEGEIPGEAGSFCWLFAMMDGDDGIWDKSIGKVSVGNRRYFEMYTEAQILDGPLLRFSLLKSTIDSKTNEIFSHMNLVHFFLFLFYNLIINFEL